jgi:outer membrane protein insertion porin family
MTFARNVWILLAASSTFLGGCAATDPARSLPGKKIVFEGAEKYSEGELRNLIRKEIRRYSERPRQTVLDDAVFRIESRYRLRGHARIQVSVKETSEMIRFTIDEGPRVTLSRVHFLGYHAISKKRLKEIVPKGFLGAAPSFSPRLLALMIDHVKVLYRAKGYLDVKIARPVLSYDEEEQEMSVRLRITEGREFVLGRLDGLPSEPEEVASLSRFVGKPYASGTPEALEARLIDHYRDRGFPFVQVQSRVTVNRETARVTLRLDVNKGDHARVGELHLEGNDRTRDSHVRKRTGIDRGDEFRSSELFMGEQRLRETGLFRSVEIQPDPVRTEPGIVGLKVLLEENEPGEVSLRAGYGTLEGPRGGLALAYRNLFGGGELAEIGMELNQIGFRGSGEFALPFFLGSTFRPSLSAFLEARAYPNFDATSQGGVLSIGYPLLRRVTATAGVRQARIETEDVDPGVDPGDLLDFDFTALFLSASWDGRDSVALPTRGSHLRLQVEWSPGEFGSEIQFGNVSGRGGVFFSLPGNLVLAASLQGGLIRPLQDTDVIPISLRYFAGGTNTVRGFEVNDIAESGGEAYLALQLELRFPIWAGFHGSLFHDRGGVWFDRKDFDLDDTRWSVGGGLRYYTPAGPISADVGWNPDRKSGEDSVEFHFSIGFPF